MFLSRLKLIFNCKNIMPDLQNHSHERFLAEYTTNETIGEGSSKVTRGKRNADDCDVAVKVIKYFMMSSTDEVPLEFIYQRKASENNPGVMKIYDWFRWGNRLALVMEFSEKFIALDKFIEEKHKISENDQKYIFLQILNAIEKCHENGVCHLDIKLNNILINSHDFQVKLIDFGVAKQTKDAVHARGQMMYRPPEYFRNKNMTFSGKYLDHWAAGIVLFRLLNSTKLFESKYEIMEPHSTLRRKVNGYCTPQARHLLQALLHPYQGERIEVKAIVDHDWIVESIEQDKRVHQQRMNLIKLIGKN